MQGVNLKNLKRAFNFRQCGVRRECLRLPSRNWVDLYFNVTIIIMNPLKSFWHKFHLGSSEISKKLLCLFTHAHSLYVAAENRETGNESLTSLVSVRLIMCVFICVTNNKNFTVFPLRRNARFQNLWWFFERDFTTFATGFSFYGR